MTYFILLLGGTIFLIPDFGIYLLFFFISCLLLVKCFRGLLMIHSWIVYLMNLLIFLITSTCWSISKFSFWSVAPLFLYSFLVIKTYFTFILGVYSNTIWICPSGCFHFQLSCILELFLVGFHCIKVWYTYWPYYES